MTDSEFSARYIENFEKGLFFLAIKTRTGGVVLTHKGAGVK